MAGTFGYEAEHYDLSMKVGELKLLPQIRQLHSEKHDAGDRSSEITNRQSKIVNRKSTIASSGSACRMQIRQGAGVEAVHPILLVQKRLEGATVGAVYGGVPEADERQS
jgi:Fe-S oxidoreductase